MRPDRLIRAVFEQRIFGFVFWPYKNEIRIANKIMFVVVGTSLNSAKCLSLRAHQAAT